MPSYLVTGGLGFIGSHLAALLLDDPEAHITVVDNLQGQVLPVDYLIDEIGSGKHGRLEVCVGDIAEYQPLRPFKVIYHFASVVGPAAVLDYSGFMSETIVRDTYAVIRMAQSHHSRLVNISTSEVYGGGDHGLCTEDTPRVIRGPASARQEYAAAKLSCEVSIANLCREGRLDAVTVRPFNVSGVRQLGKGGFVLPRLVGQAMLGFPLTVFGDGMQVRAFTDVRDVAEGIRLVGNIGQTGAVYNVGNPHNRLTIRDLAGLVLQITGSSSKIRFVDPKEIYGNHYEEAANKFPDALRLMALGWQPHFSVSQTVQAVYDSLKGMSPTQVKLVANLTDHEAMSPISDPLPVAIG